ncbi:MAG: hypothetical protein ACE5KM_12570 [Planctomycetaceae bacterium]
MFQEITGTLGYYWDYYTGLFRSEWNHMTPTKYAALLLFVCAVGFVTMKSKIKSI